MSVSKDSMLNSSDIVSDLRASADAVLQNLQNRLENQGSSSKKPSVKELEDMALRQQTPLARVMESAVFLGHVIAIPEDQKDPKSNITISCYGRLLEVKPVPDLELKVGDTVRLAPNSSQIIGISGDLNIGSICLVRRTVDENFSEVDFSGSIRRVLNGIFAGKLEAEDRVILDSSGSVVIGRLEKAATRFNLGSRPTIRWDDICGLEDAKMQLKEVVEMPYLYPELYKYFSLDKEQSNGALVYGPPGCGKTMLFEAAATSWQELHGDSALTSGFTLINGPEVLDMHVGIAEQTIRKIFETGKKHYLKYNYPSILVVEEAESLLSKRGSGKSSDMEKTIVPTFLTEMQGIDDSSMIVFLSTNRPDVLDPAVIRDGRINRHIKVGRPDRDGARAIFEKNFAKYPLAGNLQEFASYAADEFYSDQYPIYEIARSSGQTVRFKLSDLVNGAMPVNVVKKAVWNALQRNVASGGERDANKRSSVQKDDIKKAVEDTYRQKFDLPHIDELKDYVADFKDEIKDVKKLQLRQSQKE